MLTSLTFVIQFIWIILSNILNFFAKTMLFSYSYGRNSRLFFYCFLLKSWKDECYLSFYKLKAFDLFNTPISGPKVLFYLFYAILFCSIFIDWFIIFLIFLNWNLKLTFVFHVDFKNKKRNAMPSILVFNFI